VLTRPNVTLYALRGDLAFFVETPDDLNIYSPSVNAFMPAAQCENARTLYLVPIPIFFEVAARLCEPSCRCLWIPSVGRCGSTLITQLAATQPNVTGMSEPTALIMCGMLCDPDYRVVGPWAKEDPLRVTAACVKILLKDFTTRDFVCIKPRPATSIQNSVAVQELFPSMRHLFLFRNVRPFIESRARLEKSLAPNLACGPCLICLAGRYIKTLDIFWPVGSDRRRSSFSITRFVHHVVFWAESIQAARAFLESGPRGSHFSLNYDDMVAQKYETCQAVLSLCGLPCESADVHLALQAFSKDSQKVSFIPKTVTGDFKETFTAREVKAYDSILASRGIDCSFTGCLNSLPCDILQKHDTRLEE